MASHPVAYEFNRFRVETRRRLLIRDAQPVPLTPKVFDALLYLVERRGAVVTKEEMLASLWPDTAVEENNLGQAISKLRQALGEVPGENAYIATIPGRGYRFVAETRVVEEGPDPAVADGQPAIDKSTRWPVGVVVLLVAACVALVYVSSTRGGTNVALPVSSVAVLPFKPLVPQNRDEALEFGIADILIGRLATLENLSVRPLGRVRRYTGTTMNPVDAGRELGVDAVLDGHIHRSDQRIRVTARLVRVADERQLWSGQFDEEFKNVFDIQDAIARRVTEQLAPELDAGARERMTSRDTSDPAAYESYLRGRLFMSLAQPDNAIRMFEEAVNKDPGFAVAHAGLADIYSRLPVATDGPSTDAMARARSAATRAAAINPDLAEAHAALGWIAFYHDWQWVESEARFTRALQINPAFFSAHLGLAHLFSNTGRHEAALRQVEQALAVEPTSPLAAALRAQFLFYAQRYDEAREQARRTVAAAPGFWIARITLGRLHLRDRNLADALVEFESAQRSGGRHGASSLIGYTHGIAGRRAEASGVLRALIDASRQSYVPPYQIAVLHQGLGDDDEALRWLEKGYADKDVRMVFIGVDPLWDGLRRQPRFAALLKSMNFAP